MDPALPPPPEPPEAVKPEGQVQAEEEMGVPQSNGPVIVPPPPHVLSGLQANAHVMY